MTMNQLPEGYRQSLVMAITVILGFSLAFLRFWGLEASGSWSLRSFVSVTFLGASILTMFVSLFRALRINADAAHYQRTVRWFLTGVILLAVGVSASIVVAAVENF